MSKPTQSSAPTLLILAAGMGSRYGGLKQLDGMGPEGETIIEYSIHDAIRCGFQKVVAVVREDFVDSFHKKIGARFETQIEIRYVFQGMESQLPNWFSPSERNKPWGTGHALLCAREEIDEPFAVINADDFYGRPGFQAAQHILAEECTPTQCAMIGYPLKNTLTDHGAVNRGLCAVDENNQLISIQERHGIQRDPHGILWCSDPEYSGPLDEDSVVSMNFWLFHPSIFSMAESYFHQFLRADGSRADSEFYIPSIVDMALQGRELTCQVETVDSRWLGVTYQEDRDQVAESLFKMHQVGIYPSLSRNK